MLKTLMLRSTLIALICSLSFAAYAVADSPKRIDIPAGDLAGALDTLAKQAGVEILYQTERVKGLRTRGVNGNLTAQEAIARLLEGTPLTLKTDESGAMLVAPANSSAKTSLSRDASTGMILAQTDPSLGTGEGGARREGEGKDSSESSSPEDSTLKEFDTQAIPEILVTGTRGWSLNADIERTKDDVRPYIVIDQEAIQRSGAANVDELLRNRVPMNYAQVPNNTLPNSASVLGNSSRISLRGLPEAETLILIDGRRTTGLKSGQNELQSDVNTIPLAMIERIEVLSSTASGIYGGHATGGVVNIVLRRDYSGVSTSVTYGNSFDHGAEARSFSLLGGYSPDGGRTSILLSGTYANVDPLLAGDRKFVAKRRARFQEAQIAQIPDIYYNSENPLTGAATNISAVSVDGVVPNLVLKTGPELGSPITSVPVGYPGFESDDGAGFLQNAGRYNLDLGNSDQEGGLYANLLGQTRVATANFTVRSRLTSEVSAFIDASAARNEQRYQRSGLQAFFYVPSTAITNPFEQDIWVNAPVNVRHSESRTKSDSLRATAGILVQMTPKWTAGIDYSWSRTQSENTSPSDIFSDEAALQVETGSLDLLRSPESYSEQILEFTLPGNYVDPIRSRLDDVTLRLVGPLLSLPAGRVTLSTAAEGRKQTYSGFSSTLWFSSGDPFTLELSDGQEKVASLYSEVRIPLASETKPLFSMQFAELQLAGRYDKYNLRASYNLAQVDPGTRPDRQEFHSIDPTIGLRFRPIRDVTVRGSFGTGFLPPYLSQLQSRTPRSQSYSFLTDPKRGNEALGVVSVLNGGNPELRPETSTSWSAGVIFEPRNLQNVRLSIDWTRIRKRDKILSLTASQEFINQENLVPGFVIRGEVDGQSCNPVCPIVAFDQRNRNLTFALSESLDLAVDYGFSIGGVGRYELTILATRLRHNLQQAAPLTPAVERGGTSLSPTWAANATLTWRLESLAVMASARYLDSYWLSADHSYSINALTARTPSLSYLDLGVEYGFRGRKGIWKDNLVVQAGIKNLLNTSPRYIGAGYDVTSDPRMASYFVTLRKDL